MRDYFPLLTKYFDYEIFGELKNAKYLQKNGFFVGNHQIDISNQINLLNSVIGGGRPLNNKFQISIAYLSELKAA